MRNNSTSYLNINMIFFQIICIVYFSLTVVYSQSTSNGGFDLLSVPELCFKGPEIWCKDFTNAIQCNAAKHCIQTVWSKTDSSSSDSCSTCVVQMNKIRNGIDSNTTKEVIEEALDYICEITFITKIFRKKCEYVINKYVDENINEILDLLKSDIDSETICHILWFCSAHPQQIIEDDDEVVLQFQNTIMHVPGHDIQITDLFSPHIVKVTRKPMLVGAEKCTWGPSYWCENLTTSKQCHSTSHCVSKFWSNTNFKEDDDSVCQVCKDMVKQARDQLRSNETQEELKQVFEGTCKLIPIKEVRKECITLADEFVPELTEMLASEMNPTAVCTVAGLCNSARIDALLAKHLAESCVNCTVALTQFNQFLLDTQKSDVLLKILTICDELSSYSDLCASIIVTNFENIYEMMTLQLPPFAVCHLVQMCSPEYSAIDKHFKSQVDTKLAKKDDTLPCAFCEQLLQHLKNVLVSNTTEVELLQMLHRICQNTGKFANDCQKIVNDNLQVIYKFLTEELNPDQVCFEINICPRVRTLLTNQQSIISDRGRLIPVFEAKVNLSNLSPMVEVRKSSVGCRLCKTVVSQIETELKNPVYEHDIEKVLKMVCSLVPSNDQIDCQNFIVEYTDQLIKLLTEETDPNVVCVLLSICSENRKAKNELCPFCQYLLHFIQNALDDPKDQKQITETIDKLCSLVPEATKNKCDEFVSEYSSLLVSILAQEIDPSVVCPALKLCPSSLSTRVRCGHCQSLVNNLIIRLGDDHRIDNIMKNIDDGVAHIKGDEKASVALELKVTYRDDLIDMMAAEFDADESCVYLKFCDMNELVDNAGGNVQTNEIVSTETQNVNGKPSCQICEMFVKMYEKELTSNQTEEQLVKMFDNFCHKLHDPQLEKTCTQSVKQYLPKILDLLKKEVTPKELCAAAKLCSFKTVYAGHEECEACEIVIGGLESVLGDPGNTNDVVQKALQVCKYMSGTSRSICTTLMEEVLPQVEGLAFSIPPWFACTKLKMCPYGERVDYNICSDPATWCQNMENAFLCDKLQFCKQNAWEYQQPSRN